MTQDEINKMFESRWRVYGTDDAIEDNAKVKEYARKFFEAGIMLAEKPATVSENIHCEVHTCQILPDPDSHWQELDPFDYWWKLYDKKRGKEKCMKKWAKLTEKEKAECIAATPSYVFSTPDKAYRKDPLTYLNGKCWNDEIIIKHNGTNQPTIQQQRTEKLASILTD